MNEQHGIFNSWFYNHLLIETEQEIIGTEIILMMSDETHFQDCDYCKLYKKLLDRIVELENRLDGR